MDAVQAKAVDLNGIGGVKRHPQFNRLPDIQRLHKSLAGNDQAATVQLDLGPPQRMPAIPAKFGKLKANRRDTLCSNDDADDVCAGGDDVV